MVRVAALVVVFILGAVSSVAAACQADAVTLKNEHAEIQFAVELAQTPEDRSRGLMFREHLPARSGMLFVFEHPQRVAFWMKNTLIPLDMIFVDRTGTVTRIHQGAIPGDETPIPGGDQVFSVLEINAGLASRYGITEGTVLRHKVFSDGPAAWPC